MATDVMKLFTSLGLTPTESKVYLASLGLGPNSVQEIAKKAKLSRTSAYAAIEVLIQRGLMSTFARGKKKFFAAEEPDNALAHFRGYVKQLEQQIDVLQRALPEVRMMAGGERPAVRFYEGDEALMALYADAERVAPTHLREVSNMEDVYARLDPNAWQKARTLFNPAKTEIRLLHRGEVKTPRPQVQYRRLPDTFGDFHGDIWIYGNRVAFVTFVGRVITVIIESQVLAETATAMFEAAWVGAGA